MGKTKHIHADIVIPCGPCALQMQAGFVPDCCVKTSQVENDLPQGREILRCGVFAQVLAVLAEADAEYPVKPVLNFPMGTYGERKLIGSQVAGTDVSAPFKARFLVADGAYRVDPAYDFTLGSISEINASFGR